MSTQRRVVHVQRFANTEKVGTELAGTAIPSSFDVGGTVSMQEFRRVACGLTASSFRPQSGRFELATNSLSFSSCCEWVFWIAAYICLIYEARTRGSSPAPGFTRAGIFPEQLPLISPLLSGASEQERCTASCSICSMQSAPAAGPDGRAPQDGKATWPRKFVSPARRTKHGLQFLKTINSQRFTTSGRMNIHSRVPFTRAA